MTINLEKLHQLSLEEDSMHMEYYPNPKGIEKFFSHPVRMKSFPPDGVAEPNELECYFLIKRNSKVVGYYKAVDLFFENTIELHGSYDGPVNFLMKTYFFLSRKYVRSICDIFPDKKIKTVIRKDNEDILRLVYWLGFSEVGVSGDYICFEILNQPLR